MRSQHNTRLDDETWVRLRHAALDERLPATRLVEAIVLEFLDQPRSKWARNAVERAKSLQNAQKAEDS